MDRMTLGRAGEEKAVQYLKAAGCEILDRNFRCRYGEIDIIALDHGVLCFVEVKTRSRTDYGMPCQAVDRRKERRIQRCAYTYIRQHGLQHYEIRMDIIEVLYRHRRFWVRRIIDGRDA